MCAALWVWEAHLNMLGDRKKEYEQHEMNLQR